MKKLILCSDQLIRKNKKMDSELLKIFHQTKLSIAYIPSCSDLSRKYFLQTVEYYNKLGFEEIQYFDLDKEYDETKLNNIFNFSAIHLSGGNTFYFLNLLRKRGLIKLLQDYVENGGILIGISAGSILITRTIEIAEYGNDSDGIIVDNNEIKLIGDVIKIG